MPPAATSEERRRAGETWPLLLAAFGSKSSNTATVRQHSPTNCGVAVASREEKQSDRKKTPPKEPRRAPEKLLRTVAAPGAKCFHGNFRDFGTRVGGKLNWIQSGAVASQHGNSGTSWIQHGNRTDGAHSTACGHPFCARTDGASGPPQDSFYSHVARSHAQRYRPVVCARRSAVGAGE